MAHVVESKGKAAPEIASAAPERRPLPRWLITTAAVAPARTRVIAAQLKKQ